MALRVAITGAAGFLGGQLARALPRYGAEALPLVRVVDERAPKGAVAVEDALADPARLDGVDVIVHAAAVRHRHGVDARAYAASNVELTTRLLRASAGRVRRFVFVSSVGVYGFPRRLPIDESFPYAPVTLYSETKVRAEREARDVARELGIELVIARPTITYGRGDTNGMLDKLARMIRAGSYRVVGSGGNELHHTHIDDMVDGLWLAATAPRAAGEDVILAGPETITLERLSELVAAAVGQRLPRVHVPLTLARAVASGIDVAMKRGLAFTRREPPVSHEKLDVMCVAQSFDVAKARRVLGYSPKVGYEEGIRRTLARTERAR